MGRKARSALARLWIVLWAAAAGLVVVRILTDLNYQETDHFHLASPTVLIIGLAITSTILAQVQDKRDEYLIALARNLAAVTRPPVPKQPTRAPLRRAQ